MRNMVVLLLMMLRRSRAAVVIYATDTAALYEYNTQALRVAFLSLHEIIFSKLLTIFKYCASL